MPPPTYGVAFPWSKRQPASAFIGTRLMVSGTPRPNTSRSMTSTRWPVLHVTIDRSAEEEAADPHLGAAAHDRTAAVPGDRLETVLGGKPRVAELAEASESQPLRSDSLCPRDRRRWTHALGQTLWLGCVADERFEDEPCLTLQPIEARNDDFIPVFALADDRQD
jgi:hypothetical protein